MKSLQLLLFLITYQTPLINRYLITGKWTNPEGNIMYKDHWVGDWGEEGYSLSKISNSGKTLEYVSDRYKHPNKIDPKHPFYRKYTRK